MREQNKPDNRLRNNDIKTKTYENTKKINVKKETTSNFMSSHKNAKADCPSEINPNKQIDVNINSKNTNSKNINSNNINSRNLNSKSVNNKNINSKISKEKKAINTNANDKRLTNTNPNNNHEKKASNSIDSICPYMKKCGGCNYINLPYEEQLRLKQKSVNQALNEVLTQQKIKVMPIIGAENPFFYRNKVHSVFDRDARNNIIRGIYQEDTHKIVNVSKCLLEDKLADSVIEEIKKLLPSFKLKVYDEDTKTGFLRHVLIRVGHIDGNCELMVVLVTSEVKFPSKNNFIKVLCTKFKEIKTIVQNINDKKTSMVLGNRNIVIHGKGYIEDDSLGLKFRISPSAFYQINSEQTKKLYNLAYEFADLSGNETVLDAYCGTGTIGMFMAKKAKQVIGVELNKDAVRDAVSNAKANGISNIFFANSDATKYIERLQADIEAGNPEAPTIDVLCMDPPRSGSTPEFINAVAKLQIKRIVYVSCSPETLGRDLKEFTKLGYKLKKVVPVDMFPHTKHVETVCLLSRKP